MYGYDGDDDEEDVGSKCDDAFECEEVGFEGGCVRWRESLREEEREGECECEDEEIEQEDGDGCEDENGIEEMDDGDALR